MSDPDEPSLALPAPLAALGTLAYNLWSSWQPDAVALFEAIDPARWRALEHNPVRLLAETPSSRFAELVRDERYTAALAAVAAQLDAYLRAPSWAAREFRENPFRVAYFCAEYALSEALPVYSGGLGVLAGDHLKSASDLGVPLVAVGLAYAEGYHRQTIDADGWQGERYPALELAVRPCRIARSADGRPVRVHLELPDRALRARVWRVNVGRVPLYLLDADVPENRPADRRLTARLYGGDGETRLLQELLLGLGGVRALASLGERFDVCHMNEGHAAFLALEVARQLAAERGVRFARGAEVARAGTVFTTHTPVPAGNDEFPAAVVEWHLRPFREGAALSTDELVALGRPPGAEGASRFSMSVLALRSAARRNGVSALHGAVARAMWQPLFPDGSARAVPIGHVTNGVHPGTWLAPETRALLVRHATKEPDPALDEALFRAVERASDAELWALRSALRARLEEELARRGVNLAASGALTVGFARRFATYKRAALALRDPSRLARILTDASRPMRLVFAGKAHPRDEPGKRVLQQLYAATQEPRFAGRLVFLEDYDVALARALTAGCDVWLNTPRRPLEASGTSGMKSAMNGGLNLSVRDGWWDEAYTPAVGWAIGGADEEADEADPDAADARDAEALYALLEREVAPRFYQRDETAEPRAWCAMVRAAIAQLGPVYSTQRMVAEYARELYAPAARDFAAARARLPARG